MQIMQEQLVGRVYRVDHAPRWAKMIANGVRLKVEELGMKRSVSSHSHYYKPR